MIFSAIDRPVILSSPNALLLSFCWLEKWKKSVGPLGFSQPRSCMVSAVETVEAAPQPDFPHALPPSNVFVHLCAPFHHGTATTT